MPGVVLMVSVECGVGVGDAGAGFFGDEGSSGGVPGFIAEHDGGIDAAFGEPGEVEGGDGGLAVVDEGEGDRAQG
jgi:hypothetical protein